MSTHRQDTEQPQKYLALLKSKELLIRTIERRFYYVTLYQALIRYQHEEHKNENVVTISSHKKSMNYMRSRAKQYQALNQYR